MKQTHALTLSVPFFLCLACLGAGCVDFGRGPAPEPDTAGANGTGAASPPTFVTDVHPILLNRCKACHVQGGMAGGTRFLLTGDAQTDYDTVTQPSLVDLNDPPNSLLLRKPSKQMSHGGGMVMQQDSAEFATILQWIEAGVPFE